MLEYYGHLSLNNIICHLWEEGRDKSFQLIEEV